MLVDGGELDTVPKSTYCPRSYFSDPRFSTTGITSHWSSFYSTVACCIASGHPAEHRVELMSVVKGVVGESVPAFEHMKEDSIEIARVALHAAEELCEVKDPETEPFRSKYKARATLAAAKDRLLALEGVS